MKMRTPMGFEASHFSYQQLPPFARRQIHTTVLQMAFISNNEFFYPNWLPEWHRCFHKFSQLPAEIRLKIWRQFYLTPRHIAFYPQHSLVRDISEQQDYGHTEQKLTWRMYCESFD